MKTIQPRADRVAGVALLCGLIWTGAAVTTSGVGQDTATAPVRATAVQMDEPAEAIYSETVTLNVDNTSIAQVLNAFSIQTGRSIVIGPEVTGTVNMRLHDVPWQEALDVVLRPYGFGYQLVGKTIVVNRLDKIQQVQTVQQLVSRVFQLKYLDASDVKEIVEAQLSPRGDISILAARGQKGWEFGSANSGGSTSGRAAANAQKRQRLGDHENQVKSKLLIVSDIPDVITRVEDILTRIDRKPVQILIEARFVEVNSDFLRDIGVQYGTGLNGATQPGPNPVPVQQGDSLYGLAAQQSGGTVDPASFNNQSLGLSGTQPFNAGLSLLFQQLTDVQFEVFLHMLEEDVSANLLSAPRILTLNNQEAAIIVGTKFPIISSDTSGQNSTVSTTLDYYENIGIQLNVVPQICDDEQISMIVHPAVTDQIGVASAKTGSDFSQALTEYPVLATREAETQILVRNGQTIVIGGLIEDRETETLLKVPFLGDIPLLGNLFRRTTTNFQKLDLLIFLTATIVKDGEDLHTVSAPVSSDADLMETRGAATSPATEPVSPKTGRNSSPSPAPAPKDDPALSQAEDTYRRIDTFIGDVEELQRQILAELDQSKLEY